MPDNPRIRAEPVGKTEQTYGHKKQNAFANTVYFKPSLRKPVIRHPGVLRRSDKVRARNDKVKADPPATKCKNLGPGGTPTPWDIYVKCLSDKMPK